MKINLNDVITPEQINQAERLGACRESITRLRQQPYTWRELFPCEWIWALIQTPELTRALLKAGAPGGSAEEVARYDGRDGKASFMVWVLREAYSARRFDVIAELLKHDASLEREARKLVDSYLNSCHDEPRAFAAQLNALLARAATCAEGERK